MDDLEVEMNEEESPRVVRCGTCGGYTPGVYEAQHKRVIQRNAELERALKELWAWSGPGTAAENGAKCNTLFEAERMVEAALGVAELESAQREK